MEGLPLSQAVRLEFQQVHLDSDHENHPPVQRNLNRKEALSGEEMEVYLDWGCTLYGSVLDTNRRPRAGAWVLPAVLASGSFRLVSRRMTRTDDRGWFALKGVPEGFVRPMV